MAKEKKELVEDGDAEPTKTVAKKQTLSQVRKKISSDLSLGRRLESRHKILYIGNGPSPLRSKLCSLESSTVKLEGVSGVKLEVANTWNKIEAEYIPTKIKSVKKENIVRYDVKLLDKVIAGGNAILEDAWNKIEADDWIFPWNTSCRTNRLQRTKWSKYKPGERSLNTTCEEWSSTWKT